MERERIEMSCSTVRHILVKAGVNGPRPVTSAMSMPNPIMYTDWAVAVGTYSRSNTGTNCLYRFVLPPLVRGAAAGWSRGIVQLLLNSAVEAIMEEYILTRKPK